MVAEIALSVVAGLPLGEESKAWFSRKSWWYRQRKQEQELGKGGSAAYASIVEEWRYRYRLGDMVVGVSRQELSWPIDWKDDRGFLTIAENAVPRHSASDQSDGNAGSASPFAGVIGRAERADAIG